MWTKMSLLAALMAPIMESKEEMAIIVSIGLIFIVVAIYKGE